MSTQAYEFDSIEEDEDPLEKEVSELRQEVANLKTQLAAQGRPQPEPEPTPLPDKTPYARGLEWSDEVDQEYVRRIHEAAGDMQVRALLDEARRLRTEGPLRQIPAVGTDAWRDSVAHLLPDTISSGIKPSARDAEAVLQAALKKCNNQDEVVAVLKAFNTPMAEAY